MKIVLTIIVMFGIISTLRTYKKCKRQNISFNPYEAHSFIEFLGMVLFGIVLLSMIFYIIALIVQLLIFK
jgi:hypothetical protein